MLYADIHALTVIQNFTGLKIMSPGMLYHYCLHILHAVMIENLISYSTVVLYIGIMKVRGFWPEIITPKPA